MGKGAQDFVARRPNYEGIDVSDPASLNIATVTWDWIKRLRETFPDLPDDPDPKTVFLKLRELRNKW